MGLLSSIGVMVEAISLNLSKGFEDLSVERILLIGRCDVEGAPSQQQDELENCSSIVSHDEHALSY